MTASSLFLDLVDSELPSSKNLSEKNLTLAEEASLLKAVTNVLDNQSVYNHVIEEMLKMVTRIGGWLLLTLVTFI